MRHGVCGRTHVPAGSTYVTLGEALSLPEPWFPDLESEVDCE